MYFTRRGFWNLVLAAAAAPAVQPLVKAADAVWPSKPIGWLGLIDDTGKEWYGPGYQRQPIFNNHPCSFNFGPLGEVPGRYVTHLEVHVEDPIGFGFPYMADSIPRFSRVPICSVVPGKGQIVASFLKPPVQLI